MEKTVCVLGLGYIGLPTAALLANSHHYRVLGVDVQPAVVETINRGDIHIIEPDLDTFVRAAVGSGRLVASLEPGPADVFMIAVPTPFRGDHEPDLSYVLAATRALAGHVRPGNLVILESTSPVGTTEQVARVLEQAGVDTSQVHLAYCPERVLPGHVMRELIDNDRVVGGINEAATRAVADFYRTFVTGQVLETDARTAEMCKLTENASRDVQIAFANELSMVCARLGIDVWELIELANKHPRVNILWPGPGVGGHCIAVDPWFIVHGAPDEARLIRQARLVNNDKTRWVIEAIAEAIGDGARVLGRPPVVAVMGLAFKPNIDDLRESPALEIAHHLAAHTPEGARCLFVEPHVEQAPGLPALTEAPAALAEADLVVWLVAHESFLRLTVPPRARVMDVCGLSRLRPR